jgi:hypothetical protein
MARPDILPLVHRRTPATELGRGLTGSRVIGDEGENGDWVLFIYSLTSKEVRVGVFGVAWERIGR